MLDQLSYFFYQEEFIPEPIAFSIEPMESTPI